MALLGDRHVSLRFRSQKQAASAIYMSLVVHCSETRVVSRAKAPIAALECEKNVPSSVHKKGSGTRIQNHALSLYQYTRSAQRRS